MTNEQDDLNLEEILSEDELQILGTINQKIYKHLEDKHKEHRFDHLNNDEALDLSDKHPDIIHREHITDCPHEMRITLDAKISSIDERGNLKEIKDLYMKHFHIPIPSHTNYVTVAERFFETFQSKLYATCTEEIKPLFKDVQSKTK